MFETARTESCRMLNDYHNMLISESEQRNHSEDRCLISNEDQKCSTNEKVLFHLNPL